jgi:hypothetical protein
MAQPLNSNAFKVKARGFTVSALALCCAATVHAQSLNFIERDNTFNVTFSNQMFTGAYLNGDIAQYWSGPMGSYFGENFGIPSGFNLTSWTGDSNVGVSGVVTTPGNFSGTVTSLTGQNGWTNAYISGPSNSSPSFFSTGVQNGFFVLDLKSNSFGGVAIGDPFYWNATFSGDWSSQGTGVGQSELLSYNPDWTIVDDFTYDSGTNLTTLTLEDAYDGSGPGVSLQLNGASASAVPGPAAVAPFGIGLLSLLRRRRRV